MSSPGDNPGLLSPGRGVITLGVLDGTGHLVPRDSAGPRVGFFVWEEQT